MSINQSRLRSPNERMFVNMVMELAPGGDLFALLRRVPGGACSERDARFYVAGVSLALEHLHDVLGVVFRDVKLENIVVAANGYPQLADFGLARRLAR